MSILCTFMMFSICSSPYLIFSSHLGLEFVNGLFEIMPPLSHSPFLPLPHPVSWRIKLMIVPVLNYSWFNKIDAYLFRFVASQSFLSLLNHHYIIFHFKIMGFTPLVLLAFCKCLCQQPSPIHPIWNVSRGISHPSGQPSPFTQYSNLLFTHLVETLWLYSNKYTVSKNM